MESEFKSFGEIKKYTGAHVTITQKIHGTNAQVYIYKDESDEMQIKTGSRTRWITPEDDNYNFSKFVFNNRQEFIDKLGEGRHYGEFCGPGINSGEGLKERELILFDYSRYTELPVRVRVVPVLFSGFMENLSEIDTIFNKLKETGSLLSPGFMNVEGIVININGQRFKKVFNPEETQWSKSKKDKQKSNKEPKIIIDASHLLQPIRLEKLLSRDENYIKDYPKSLGLICKDYIADLEKESQLPELIDDELKVYKKNITGQVFNFIKTIVDENLGK